MAGARTIKGWGSFQTEEELFDCMDAEIGRQRQELSHYRRSGDVEAAGWMLDEGYTEAEIMETLGIRRRELRRIMRLLNTETQEEV